MVRPSDNKKSVSKQLNTSLLGWWMDAIIVLPSLARFLSLDVTKYAAALQNHKNEHQSTKMGHLLQSLLFIEFYNTRFIKRDWKIEDRAAQLQDIVLLLSHSYRILGLQLHIGVKLPPWSTPHAWLNAHVTGAVKSSSHYNQVTKSNAQISRIWCAQPVKAAGGLIKIHQARPG